MAGTTRLELATSAVTVDIKRCRRTSLDTVRHRMSPVIVPLMYPELASSVDFSDPISAQLPGLPTNQACEIYWGGKCKMRPRGKSCGTLGNTFDAGSGGWR